MGHIINEMMSDVWQNIIYETLNSGEGYPHVSVSLSYRITFAVYVEDVSVCLKCDGSVNPIHSPRSGYMYFFSEMQTNCGDVKPG